MTDEDPINDDEVEDPLDDEEEGDDSDIVDSDDIVSTPASSKVAEVIDDFSIASRQRAREELDAQVAAFLARGGVISEVPANVTADPPKKPSPDYGGRPI